jgi:hypothetical protein
VKKLPDAWDKEGLKTAWEGFKRNMACIIMYSARNPEWSLHSVSDASNTAWGSAVFQVKMSERYSALGDMTSVQLLAVHCGAFRGSQLRWATVDKEAYGLVQSFLLNKSLLSTGNDERPVVIHTDHKNLLFLLKGDNGEGVVASKQCRARLRRFSAELATFRTEFRHTPGVENCFTDFLSRGAQRVYEIPKFPIERKEKANADENMQRLLVGAWDNAAVPSAKQVKRAQQKFKKDYIRDHGAEKWKNDFRMFLDADGLVCNSILPHWEGKIFTMDGKAWIPPQYHDLLIRIIALAHGGDAGHRSRKHTAEAVAKRSFCTDMDIAKLAEEFVENCLICNCCDVRKIIPHSFGQHMVATEPNEILSWDYLSMGPVGNGDFAYVLVLKDHFSGYVSLAPCQAQDSQTSALHIVEWVTNFGFPKVVISDNGTPFTVALV